MSICVPNRIFNRQWPIVRLLGHEFYTISYGVYSGGMSFEVLWDAIGKLDWEWEVFAKYSSLVLITSANLSSSALPFRPK